MSDWKFRRRQGWCTTCETAFAEGERHVSALSVRDEDLAREDACLACWGKRSGAGDVFFWFTRHLAAKRGMQLDLATLEQLFLQLESRTEPRVRELRYVLCLLLMRKRRLKIDRVLRGSGEEGESMLVHRPRRKETLRVFVFDFSNERMAELRADLMGIFEGAEPFQDGTAAGGSSLGVDAPEQAVLAGAGSPAAFESSRGAGAVEPQSSTNTGVA